MVIYVHPKLKLVCKAPVCVMGKFVEGVMVPTIKLAGTDGWVVQPLCTFDRRAEAHRDVVKRLGPQSERRWFDCHVWNCGRWRGKPFLYDW